MFTKVIRTAMLATAVTFLAQVGAVQAQQKAWMYGGQIDKIDHANHIIMVNDLPLQYTATSLMYSHGRKPIAAAELTVGDTVGVNFKTQPGMGRVITEIQRYRPGTKPRLDNSDE